MFLIKRLWVDPQENRDAYGYKAIGVVTTQEEADRICALAFMPKSKYPYPLDYVKGKGDVPVFTFEEIPTLDGMTLEQLNDLRLRG